jgi:hypothetical protein
MPFSAPKNRIRFAPFPVCLPSYRLRTFTKNRSRVSIPGPFPESALLWRLGHRMHEKGADLQRGIKYITCIVITLIIKKRTLVSIYVLINRNYSMTFKNIMVILIMNSNIIEDINISNQE